MFFRNSAQIFFNAFVHKFFSRPYFSWATVRVSNFAALNLANKLFANFIKRAAL